MKTKGAERLIHMPFSLGPLFLTTVVLTTPHTYTHRKQRHTRTHVRASSPPRRLISHLT